MCHGGLCPILHHNSWALAQSPLIIWASVQRGTHSQIVKFPLLLPLILPSALQIALFLQLTWWAKVPAGAPGLQSNTSHNSSHTTLFNWYVEYNSLSLSVITVWSVGALSWTTNSLQTSQIRSGISALQSTHNAGTITQLSIARMNIDNCGLNINERPKATLKWQTGLPHLHLFCWHKLAFRWIIHGRKRVCLSFRSATED